MKFIKISVVAAAMAVSASILQAATISGAYVGCLTPEILDEFVAAAVEDDYQHMQALTGTFCMSVEGMEYSVVDRGWMESQIRVYTQGQSILLWVINSAIR